MSAHDEDRRREIDEELQAHVEARVAHLQAQGLSEADARAEALRRFGNLQTGRARLYAFARADRRRRDVRDRFDSIRQDVRYVFRSLARHPGFALGTIATLAIGLGINSAIFRIADRVLFRAPDGVVDPDRVQRLEAAPPVGGDAPSALFSYPEGRAAADSGALTQAALTTQPRWLTTEEGREIGVVYVDAAYFGLLGLRPAVGRFLDAGESDPGAAVAVAVVSHHYWQRVLGSTPLDGLTIMVNGRTATVIGVGPPDFRGIELDPVDVWMPFGMGSFGRGQINGVEIPWYRMTMYRGVQVLGRVDDAHPPGAAEPRLGAALTTATGVTEPRRARLVPIVPIGATSLNETSRSLLQRLGGVALIVLLMAIANSAHLLLARGLRRQHEIATRLALGASRARIWRLLMTESVVLALAAGGAAVLSAAWSAAALQRLVMPDGRWSAAGFDYRTLVFTVLLALTAGIAAGLAPAAQALAPGLSNAIKSARSGGSPRTRLTRGLLLAGQTSLSIAMLVAAGLLVLSLVRLTHMPLGFEPANLLTVSLPSGLFGRPAAGDTTASDLAARLAREGPGAGIALTSVAPFGASKVVSILVPGSTFTPADAETPRMAEVDDRYFPVMRTNVLWGRGFRRDDVEGEPVSVVNTSMAQAYWGAELPPGACVLVRGRACARVVGIVEDVREAPGTAPAPMRFYLPLDTRYVTASTLVLRAPAEGAADLASRVRAMLPATQRAVIEITQDRIDLAVRPWRTATILFVTLGLVALTLACVGIYSIVSHAASERVHEMGVRVALGADARDLIGLVVRSGLRLAAIGGAIGLVGAALGGHLLAALLFDVSPFEPGVYVAAWVGMTLASLVAMLPPARRAARVDAVVALRHD